MPTGFVIGDRGLGASGDTHPAWMMAHTQSGPYLIVGASAAGQLHLAKQLPRDDAFLIRSIGSWLAVAVADGVGSRPLSRYGATYAVESLTSQLLRPFTALPKPAKPEPSIKTSSSVRNDLAPPSAAEELELVPFELKSFHEAKRSIREIFMTTLSSWRQKQGENLSPSLPEKVSQEFLQVASVGWWPSPDFSASHEKLQQGVQASRSTQFKDPTVTAVPGQVEGESQSQLLLGDINLLPIVRKAFDKSHQGLRHHAESLGIELKELGCTALALLLNIETGTGAVGQIGDGAILGLTTHGKVEELVHAPDTDDPQATYTLNSSNFDQYLAVSVFDPPAISPYVAFFIMSDGVSGDLLYSSRPLEEWATPLNGNVLAAPSPAQAATGMLNWLASYRIQGSWDDRTLVVITRREKSHGNDQPITEQQESTDATHYS